LWDGQVARLVGEVRRPGCAPEDTTPRAAATAANPNATAAIPSEQMAASALGH
jgi:hypothetical protein